MNRDSKTGLPIPRGEYIAELEIDERTRVFVLSEQKEQKYGGGYGLDIRRWFKLDGGKWTPTKSGLFFRLDSYHTIVTDEDGNESELSDVEWLAEALLGFLSFYAEKGE